MWLLVGISIPIILVIMMITADTARESVSDWQAYWMSMLFFASPFLAYGAGLLYLFFR